MVDRDARNEVAEVLRQFASGRLTNRDFENRFPSSPDPAIGAIEDTVWCFYDDFRTHKMSGEWEIVPEWKTIIARWIVFLHSSEEYRWPKISYPGVRPLEFVLLKRREQRFLEAGEHEYWPFLDEASYEKAKSNPVLLAST